MTFSDENAERARRNQNDVEVYFANGNRITINLSELKDGKLLGSSENYGKDKSFDLSAFIGIRFSLYNENIDKADFERILFDN